MVGAKRERLLPKVLADAWDRDKTSGSNTGSPPPWLRGGATHGPAGPHSGPSGVWAR